MARYLEYDKTSGRILSEITSDTKPETSENCGLLEISGNDEINTTLYAVRSGQLVKLYESETERQERERIRREQMESIRQRVKGMTYELCLAILDANDDAVKDLQNEYRSLKAYF